MKRMKFLACLLASLLLCGAASGCSSTSPEPEAPTEAETEPTTEEETQPETVVFEEAVDAQPGQAYLAIVDGQWWIQYWGSSTERGSMLAYDAGVCDITGEGSYTVSVNADTVGFRYDTTNDPHGEYTPSGLSFAAVIIQDGETVCPDYIITIDSIVIDGKEIEMTAKNVTNTEEGCIRSNIYNPYAETLSGDARCAEGMLFNDFDINSPALDNVDDYSPQIVDPKDFSAWTKVEVNFTISLKPDKTNDADSGEAVEPDTSAEATEEATVEETSEEAAEESSEADMEAAINNANEEIKNKLSEVAAYRDAVKKPEE